eukprot:TRINITY_DN87044_c0_g1_i1.p1 TRINITY_DN87044_c0_g1~~TRINITY_DN87044_c0_g1_i1.p1  ORF type:complete len:168 (-),score=14.36 TRINITY_DN87044_c0_g1_i1:212-715(-)
MNRDDFLDDPAMPHTHHKYCPADGGFYNINTQVLRNIGSGMTNDHIIELQLIKEVLSKLPCDQLEEAALVSIIQTMNRTDNLKSIDQATNTRKRNAVEDFLMGREYESCYLEQIKIHWEGRLKRLVDSNCTEGCATPFIVAMDALLDTHPNNKAMNRGPAPGCHQVT